MTYIAIKTRRHEHSTKSIDSIFSGTAFKSSHFILENTAANVILFRWDWRVIKGNVRSYHERMLLDEEIEILVREQMRP